MNETLLADFEVMDTTGPVLLSRFIPIRAITAFFIHFSRIDSMPTLMFLYSNCYNDDTIVPSYQSVSQA